MRRYSRCCVVSLALAVGGCSHIPDPGTVPGVEPYHILQNIRCEIAGVLLNEYPKGDRYYDWIREADIAYGLTLRAEEKKNASGSLTWLWPLHPGTFTLNVNAGKERERSGENSSSLAEEVKATLAMVEEQTVVPGLRPHEAGSCRPPLHTIAYPILGKIGMSDIIRRFVEVNSIAPTYKQDSLLADVDNSGGKYLHTLKFSLKFLGGVKPSFEIKRLDGSQFSGEADLNGSRLDYHELIIAMAPPAPDELRVGRGARAKAGRRVGGARAGRQQNLTRDIRDQQFLQRFPLTPLR